MTQRNRSKPGDLPPSHTSDPPFLTGGASKASTRTKTCGNGPCSCEIADDLDHCGPTCRMGIGGDSEEKCFCGHALCSASTGEAPIDH